MEVHQKCTLGLFGRGGRKPRIYLWLLQLVLLYSDGLNYHQDVYLV